MGEVDAEDDGTERWIVWHYRFDPVRRERRNVFVAAFDSASEMEARLHAEQKLLDAAKREGRAEEQERISGARKGPGHADRAQASRRAWKEARREP